MNGDTVPCWGHGGGWNDNTYQQWPDWLRVDLPRAYALSRIDLFSFQDNFSTLREEPYIGMMVGGNYVNEDFTIWVCTNCTGPSSVLYQTCNGNPAEHWVKVDDVEDNESVTHESRFTPTLASAYCVNITAAYADWSRVVEFEAYVK